MTEWEKLSQKIESEEWRDMASSIAITVLSFLHQHKMTKHQLAEKMGVKPQYVSRVVKGQTNLTLDTIVKLEKALGESIVTVTDPTALISATAAVIAPNIIWRGFYEAEVKGNAAEVSPEPEAEYTVNDNVYSLAS